jgi:hypothetical protein
LMVVLPVTEVGFDIGVDTPSFYFVAHDALVNIALPDRDAGCASQAVDQPGGARKLWPIGGVVSCPALTDPDPTGVR